MTYLLNKIRQFGNELVFQYMPTGELIVVSVSDDISKVDTDNWDLMYMTLVEILDQCEFVGML